jgi:hypothetical protein
MHVYTCLCDPRVCTCLCDTHVCTCLCRPRVCTCLCDTHVCTSLCHSPHARVCVARVSASLATCMCTRVCVTPPLCCGTGPLGASVCPCLMRRQGPGWLSLVRVWVAWLTPGVDRHRLIDNTRPSRPHSSLPGHARCVAFFAVLGNHSATCIYLCRVCSPSPFNHLCHHCPPPPISLRLLHHPTLLHCHPLTSLLLPAVDLLASDDACSQGVPVALVVAS